MERRGRESFSDLLFITLVKIFFLFFLETDPPESLVVRVEEGSSDYRADLRNLSLSLYRVKGSRSNFRTATVVVLVTDTYRFLYPCM